MSTKKKDVAECDVEHVGTAITLPALPEPMAIATAIDVLGRKLVQQEQIVAFSETFTGFPWDMAVLFVNVLKRVCGWSETRGGARLISIPTGPDTVIGAQLGAYRLPWFEDGEQLSVGGTFDGECMRFQIVGQCKRKHYPQITALFEAVREAFPRESIYQGKAIIMKCDDDGDVLIDGPFGFVDTRDVRPEEVIFSADVREQIDAELLQPIMSTAKCREAGIPLKRGVLLCGPYGCGKTLVASVAAKACETHGWTFVHLQDVRGLATALQFARAYQPALVFAEDCDSIIGTQERTHEVNQLLNTIDGVVGKNDAVMTVLTSNHPETLNRALLRPGRLDSVIHVTPPDALAVAALMTLYTRGKLAWDADLTKASEVLAGQIPAVIREVCERAKLHAIARGEHNGTLRLNGDDLHASALSMQRHLALLSGTTVAPSTGDVLASALFQITRDRNFTPPPALKH